MKKIFVCWLYTIVSIAFLTYSVLKMNEMRRLDREEREIILERLEKTCKGEIVSFAIEGHKISVVCK